MRGPDALREVAGRWLAAAADDLSAARLLAGSADISPDVACFHAQQAAEKALKAILIVAGEDVPRSHDLDRLHQLVVQAGLRQVDVPGGELAWLAEVGLGGRCPDGSRDDVATPADVERAVALAADVVTAAQAVLDEA